MDIVSFRGGESTTATSGVTADAREAGTTIAFDETNDETPERPRPG
tara:strand:- start:217 stop:354 length:138 start_codon:yes stop_codon:yes gene_type:complete